MNPCELSNAAKPLERSHQRCNVTILTDTELPFDDSCQWFQHYLSKHNLFRRLMTFSQADDKRCPDNVDSQRNLLKCIHHPLIIEYPE